MLTIYRRHRKACKHRDKGRERRHCQCPIWVDGFLGGKELRESLKLRDWQRAQETVREWEANDRRDVKPERKTLENAWGDYRADMQARKLYKETQYTKSKRTASSTAQGRIAPLSRSPR